MLAVLPSNLFHVAKVSDHVHVGTAEVLTLFRMDFFGAAHGWGEAFCPPLPKIRHTYPTIMKLGTVIPYLRKIRKMYKSCDKFLELC